MDRSLAWPGSSRTSPLSIASTRMQRSSRVKWRLVSNVNGLPPSCSDAGGTARPWFATTSRARVPDLAYDFGFRDDRAGIRCPLSAHIRVANARDQELT